MSADTPTKDTNTMPPFRKMLALDYYDGPKDGIAECAAGHVAVLRMLDWDDLQDVRIFAVWENLRERFDTLVAALVQSTHPRWPVFVPSSELPSDAQQYVRRQMKLADGTPDYVIACENPTKAVIIRKPYPAGVDPKHHDWFIELGLARKRSGL